MRIPMLHLTAAFLLLSATGATRAEQGEMRLWYAQPAAKWVEALPLGNGRLGAMVFGGVSEERVQLNEESLWAGEPFDPYPPEPVGSLAEVRRLVLDGKLQEAHRGISIDVSPQSHVRLASVGQKASVKVLKEIA